MNKVNKKKYIKITSILVALGLLLSSILFVTPDPNSITSVFSNQVSRDTKLQQDNKYKGGYGTLQVQNTTGNDKIKVYPGGTSVGVKISTNGVLAVGYAEVEINNQIKESPAKSSGIEIGDVLLKVNGKKIESSKDLSKKLNEVKEQNAEITIVRNDNESVKNINLLKDSDNKVKIGLWVRDSTAGVGTLTFYHKETNIYGALGHPITDSETDKILDVKEGNLLESSVINIRKGEKGIPGELKGIFVNDGSPIGTVGNNTQCGIFGKMNKYKTSDEFNKAYEVAYKDEIQLGKAYIITTLDEVGPRKYEIEIVKLLNQKEAGPKSMVIKVTDPELLERTGGIVQGMSGSPIIQNDKIIGAVTHVLVNKPDTGYGIYIEWMLKDAKIIN